VAGDFSIVKGAIVLQVPLQTNALYSDPYKAQKEYVSNTDPSSLGEPSPVVTLSLCSWAEAWQASPKASMCTKHNALVIGPPMQGGP